MLHYHVWFNLKPEVPEEEGLMRVERFLGTLCGAEEAATFTLLRNTGEPPRSRLPRYHALVEFADGKQLGEAMKQQVARGIHTGEHGAVVDVVTDFHVEVFTALKGGC